MSTRSPYLVTVAPGCYSGVDAPVICAYSSLRSAVRAARNSDRLRVEYDRSTRAGETLVLYSPPQRNDAVLGYGRYGNGPKRHEPSLEECVAEAKRILRDADGE